MILSDIGIATMSFKFLIFPDIDHLFLFLLGNIKLKGTY